MPLNKSRFFIFINHYITSDFAFHRNNAIYDVAKT